MGVTAICLLLSLHNTKSCVSLVLSVWESALLICVRIVEVEEEKVEVEERV